MSCTEALLKIQLNDWLICVTQTAWHAVLSDADARNSTSVVPHHKSSSLCQRVLALGINANAMQCKCNDTDVCEEKWAHTRVGEVAAAAGAFTDPYRSRPMQPTESELNWLDWAVQTGRVASPPALPCQHSHWLPLLTSRLTHTQAHKKIVLLQQLHVNCV